jgi:hypothetical protein
MSCKTKVQELPTIVNTSNNSILENIESNTSKNDTALSTLYTKFSRMLQIDNLQHGFNGEQIRIWFEYSLSDSVKVVILNNKKNIWTSDFIFFNFLYDSTETLNEINYSSESKTPKSGWNHFIQSFKNLKIANLKSFEEIQGYYLCNGGDAIIIEIANNSNYKIFGFPCYEDYETTIKEVKNIKAMINLIQQEFGYYLYPRADIIN